MSVNILVSFENMNRVWIAICHYSLYNLYMHGIMPTVYLYDRDSAGCHSLLLSCILCCIAFRVSCTVFMHSGDQCVAILNQIGPEERSVFLRCAIRILRASEIIWLTGR